MTIRTRFFLCFIIPSFIALFYLLQWVSADLRERYLESMEESLVDTATLLASIINDSSGDTVVVSKNFETALANMRNRTFEAQIYGLTKTHVDLRVYITDDQGIVLYDSEDGAAVGQNYSQWRDVYLTLNGQYGARSTRDRFTLENEGGTSTLYVASPIHHDEHIIGCLTVCKPTDNLFALLEGAKWKLTKTGAVAGLILFLIGVALTAWITRPIELLAKYTQAIREGRTASMPALGTGEIGALGKAVAEMQATLEEKSYVENYVQNLTHEIKGPLSAIRGSAELLQENMPSEKRSDFARNIEKESHRITHIIDRLLLLASVENRQGMKEETRLNLSELVEEVISSLTPLITSHAIELHTDLEKAVYIRGESFLVQQALFNLFHNAIRFTPPQGKIEAKLTVENDTALFQLKDNGEGIPDYALPRVFEKFYSRTPAHSKNKSSGLGLSLVKEVAQLHQGRIRLENNPDGGTVACLSFPVTEI